MIRLWLPLYVRKCGPIKTNKRIFVGVEVGSRLFNYFLTTHRLDQWYILMCKCLFAIYPLL